MVKDTPNPAKLKFQANYKQIQLSSLEDPGGEVAKLISVVALSSSTGGGGNLTVRNFS